MNWEQKLAKLQELKSDLLRMVEPGHWVCNIPGEIGGDGVLRSDFGQGSKPSDAVNAAYNIVQNIPNKKYITTTGWQKPRQYFRLYGDEWVRVVGWDEAC